MAVTVHLDTEQAALLDAALSFAALALETRAERVDPDKVLSKSATLQQIKLEQVRDQMVAPQQASYAAMTQDQRDMLNRQISLWEKHQDDESREAILAAIISHCDDCRLTQTRATSKGPKDGEHLRHPKMAKPAR